MNFQKYQFISEKEKITIGDFLGNRIIQDKLRKDYLVKTMIQFIIFWMYFYILHLASQVDIIITITVGVWYPIVLTLVILIWTWKLSWYWEGRWEELKNLFHIDDSKKYSLEEGIKILWKQSFLDQIWEIDFIRNTIVIDENIYWSEVQTLDSSCSAEGNYYKSTSNYCYLFKIKLNKTVQGKIEVIKIRDSKVKLWVLTSLLSFTILWALVFFFGILLLYSILLIVPLVYKTLFSLSEYTQESKSGNKRFDSKYIILWGKGNLLNKFKNSGFFDYFSEIMDRKTTYEVHIENDTMYVKIDFMRSTLSRMNFIYFNIFNFRTNKQTIIDFYIDVMRIKRLKEKIEIMR